MFTPSTNKPSPDPNASPRDIHEVTPAIVQLPERGKDFGWQLPDLLLLDDKFTGRWDYWFNAMVTKQLPSDLLPPVDFDTTPHQDTMKMLTATLDSISGHGRGSHRGWSSSTYFDYFSQWLLFGLGHGGHERNGEPPKEPLGCNGASARLLKVFDLEMLLRHPYDYFGDILAECAYGKHNSFYPTPHHVCELMVKVIMPEGEDLRTKTVCDPCTGTGRLLLHASNHSMRLFGMDIDPLLCRLALVNGYLYSPWLVRPLPFLDGGYDDPEISASISNSITASAPPHIAAKLEGTEPDTENQWQFEPIKIRRKKGSGGEGDAETGEIRQGKLF
jgi:N-6 DNA Methylase